MSSDNKGRKKRKGTHSLQSTSHQPIDPENIVSLTPQGRMLFDQLLDSISAEAGCQINGDDVGVILKQLRAQTGHNDPQFTDPKVMGIFLQIVRSFRPQS